MKKLLLLTLLPTTYINAQITLNQTDFADGGDTVRMSQTMDPSLDFVSTGTNYVWDFSTLQASSQTLKNYRPSSELSFLSSFIFGTFAPTEYKATYFIESTDIPIDQLTSVLPITIEDIFQFSRVTADSITSIGYSMVVNGTEIPFKSDTIEKRYEFPIQFGNTTYSRGYTNIDLNPTYDAVWRQYRTHTSEIDGWGSITTPFGTFDVLRINHEINEIDSIYYGGFGVWIPLAIPTSHIYEWWTNGEKEPLLRITTSSGVSGENITAVEYRDNYIDFTAGVEQLSIDFKLFPNPSKNSLSLNTNKYIDKVIITDATGKKIREILYPASAKVEVNVSDLTPGVYYVKVLSGEEVGIKSFVKE